ncbi:MAG: DUF4389 domain-containing protein [Chloroflexi bacterium]|nr:DUF4389 domain-containing protein [Chloroflexota bacterium]
MAAATYPVNYTVEYPERLSRWLIFVKWLLALPHQIVLYGLAIAVAVTSFLAWWAILFTGRYPRGLHKFAVDVSRWSARVGAYTSLFRDEYPPFAFEADYPVTLQVEYSPRITRWRLLFTGIILIPLFVVGLAYYLAYAVTAFIAFFAILFTGQYPKGLFDFGVGVNRFFIRLNMYSNLLCVGYPPFGLT